MESIQSQWVGLAVALGCGLLIGVERERRKGEGPTREAAGVRSFAVTALAGAIAQALASPALVIAGAVLVLALALIGYWKSRADDPGITTELALFVTYLLGVTAIVDARLAAAGAATVTILLWSRHPLHRFSTKLLLESELRDGLVLAGAALIVLPLVPDRAIGWLAGINPRALWSLVVILLALQAAGYVAMRVAGPRVGLPLSGLASGFVSSTATFAAMGARARSDGGLARSAIAGALLSNVATLVQLIVVTLTVAPSMMGVLWPVYVAGTLAAFAGAGIAIFRHDAVDTQPPQLERVFDIRGSLAFAAILTVVATFAAWAGDLFGASAALVAAALAGLVDVHAATASVGTLVVSGRVPVGDSGLAVVVAFTVNTASKLLAAWAGGGMRFVAAVVPGLLALLAAVWIGWWVFV